MMNGGESLSSWTQQGLAEGLQLRQEGQASHKWQRHAPWMGSGLPGGWRELQGIPIPKANGFWKGSRTRRKYGWNADKRVELKLSMGENPAQTAFMLAGPHQSLTPTALGPEALQGRGHREQERGRSTGG